MSLIPFFQALSLLTYLLVAEPPSLVTSADDVRSLACLLTVTDDDKV